MGYYPVHFSTISLILNSQTDAITPRYCFVHDNWFSTVANSHASSLSPELWDQLILSGYESRVYDENVSMFDTWSGDGPLALREPLGENPSVPDPTTQKIRNGDTDTDHTDHTDPEEDIIPNHDSYPEEDVLFYQNSEGARHSASEGALQSARGSSNSILEGVPH